MFVKLSKLTRRTPTSLQHWSINIKRDFHQSFYLCFPRKVDRNEIPYERKPARDLNARPQTDLDKEYLDRFATSEPDPGVDEDGLMNVENVYIPFLREETRQEMWKKHKENPKEWTIEKLSQHYRATIDRTKAIVYFMKSREDIMIEEFGGLTVPSEWEEIYSKHMEDPKENTTDKIAEEYKKSEPEIKTIIYKLKVHNSRKEMLENFNKKMHEYIEYADNEGADTTFREVPSGKLSNFKDKYYPALFNDEEYVDTKLRLLKRIEKETKATVEIKPESYFHVKNVNSLEQIKQQRDEYEANKVQERSKMEKTVTDRLDRFETFSRYKFAFRDTSEQSLAEKRPTMIRTRSGLWRVATPLEEMNRSWNPKPTGIEMMTTGHILDKYKDPDGDEARAKELSKLRREKHKQIKAQLAAAGGGADNKK